MRQYIALQRDTPTILEWEEIVAPIEGGGEDVTTGVPTNADDGGHKDGSMSNNNGGEQGGDKTGGGSSATLAAVAVSLVILCALCVAVFKRSTAATRFVAGPRPLVGTLLLRREHDMIDGAGEGSGEGGGDGSGDGSDFGDGSDVVAEQVCEMVTLTNTNSETDVSVPEPSTLGYKELQEESNVLSIDIT